MGGTAKQMRRGRLSATDKQYILKFHEKKTVDEIGSQLRRAPSQVAEFLASHLADLRSGRLTAVQAVHVLEHRPEWAKFQDQFDEDDLEYLKYRYDQLVNQFGQDDITNTDEMQIFQLIEVEIMQKQTLSERKPLVRQQKLLQVKLNEAYDALESDSLKGDRLKREAEAAKVHDQLSRISNELKNINARYDSYSMRISKTLEQLKATRDQRNAIDNNKGKSFLGHLRALTQEDYRREVGHEMELVRLAAEKEKLRMAKPHKYVDETVDQPLLTSETIGLFGDGSEDPPPQSGEDAADAAGAGGGR